jgi:hypothetical protein
MAILENVVFAFVKLQSPVKSLNEGDTEFTVDAIVSKAAAKQWNKEHPKNKAKSYDNDEFLEKFKFDEVPFADEDEQFVIKFKKAHSKKGVELPIKFRPRVFEPVEGDAPNDVTFEKLVANGSKGKVSFSTFSNSYGEFVQLDAILVEHMIEYKSAGGGVGSEFGATKLADAPTGQKAVKNQGGEPDEDDKPVKTKPAAKAKAKAAPADDDEDDDAPAGSPF